MLDDVVHESILKELQDCGQNLPEQEYRNNCYHLHYEVERRWDYPISNLFVVLPLDLASWDDKKPSTHQFRIYFLCGNWKNRGKIPHSHFSNHPGFRLHRPREFLQIYGDQALQVLQMVKHGGFGNGYRFPPLETFEILKGCDCDITGKQLSKENIRSHVDKAIAYLLHLSPSKRLNIKVDRTQSAAIMPYLDVPDGDRVEGDLYRSISSGGDVFWFCQAHAHQYSNRGSLEELESFVRSHGGIVDMQQSALRVDLGSTADADQFFSVLKHAGREFNVSINLKKTTTRAALERFCFAIAKQGTKVLAIDGIALDIHPRDNVQHKTSLFADLMSKPNTYRFKLITVLNYPRPKEHTIYTAGCSLHSRMLPVESWYDWVGLRDDLEQFRTAVYGTRNVSEYGSPAMKLRSALVKHGLEDVTEVMIYADETEYRKPWNATFDLAEGTFIGVYSSDLKGPPTLRSSVKLRSLAQDISDADLDQELYRIMHTNPRLRELIISTPGRDVLKQAEISVRLWRDSPRPFIFTLFDRTWTNRGRVVVQIDCGMSDNNDTEGSGVEVQEVKIQGPSTQGQAPVIDMGLECLQWDCDHFFFRFSDMYASLLDKAAEQHPSVLTSLTLDTSSLSEIGLACIKRVFARSDLEYLCILCGSFTPILSPSIAQALLSLSWHSLKTLVLTGENINGWLDLWPPVFTPRLLSLHVQGTGPSMTELSHGSVLAVHRLLYVSSLQELHIGNVGLQDERDWPLIIESTDLLLSMKS